MKIELTRTSTKDLDRLNQSTKDRVYKELYKLRDNQARFKKLKSQKKAGRLKVGKYRIIFELSGEIIYIKSVKHRREVYRDI